MGLRLVPRLSGRRPLPSGLTISVLVLLTSGITLRVVAQVGLEGSAATELQAVAALASALGIMVLAAGLAGALLSRGRGWQAWRLAAWAGTACWVVGAGWPGLVSRVSRGQCLIAFSGLVAWVGLAAFAAGLIRAARSQRRGKRVPAAPSGWAGQSPGFGDRRHSQVLLRRARPLAGATTGCRRPRFHAIARQAAAVSARSAKPSV